MKSSLARVSLVCAMLGTLVTFDVSAQEADSTRNLNSGSVSEHESRLVIDKSGDLARDLLAGLEQNAPGRKDQQLFVYNLSATMTLSPPDPGAPDDQPLTPSDPAKPDDEPASETEGRLSFFPNPVQRELSVTSDDDAFVTVYDFSGRIKFAGNVNAGSSTIDLSDLSPGRYIVVFKIKGATHRTNLIRN
jgi:hypothetical protein